MTKVVELYIDYNTIIHKKQKSHKGFKTRKPYILNKLQFQQSFPAQIQQRKKGISDHKMLKIIIEVC